MINATRFDEMRATGQLPSPSGVGLEILRLTQEEGSSAEQIARVIQADPALTGRLLKLANSGNASSARRISTMSDAVVRLGTRTVSTVGLGFTVLAGNRSGKCAGFDYQRFWSQSLARAVGTQILCSRFRQIAPADGFTAGLLGDIGRLALASIHAETYSKLLAACTNGSELELLRLEQRTFVTDHNELSAALLRDWGLPAVICTGVLHYEWIHESTLEEGTPERWLATALAAADTAAAVCVAAGEASAVALVRKFARRAEYLGLAGNDLPAALDEIYERWAEWGQMLSISTGKKPRFAEMLELSRNEPSESEGHDAPASLAAAASGETVAEPVEPAVSSPLSRRLTVVVADGNAIVCRILEQLLSRSGHRVITTRNGRDALKAFLDNGPQLVILDSDLEGLPGVEFTRRIRQTALGDQAYVVVLASNGESTVTSAFEAGADDIIVKPFQAASLFARIRGGLRVIQLQEDLVRERQQNEKTRADLAIAHRRLERDALTDVLTGLPNRRYFIDRLDHDWAAARRGATPLSCMMIDIDHFKWVNDTYGHDMGDSVLEVVADVLRQTIRGTDVVCRVGGEEFVVVSAASDLDSALRGAERLRAAVERQTIERIPQLVQPVTVSVGVASRNESTRSPEALLKTADEALLRAKRAGRNRVVGSRDAIAPPPASPVDHVNEAAQAAGASI